MKQVAAKIGCSVASLQSWKNAASHEETKASVKAKLKEIDEKVKQEIAEESAKATAKATAKAVKKSKKTRKSKKATKKSVAPAPVSTSSKQISLDEFIQDYWTKRPEAVNIFRFPLPPDEIAEAVKHVNNILLYAYEKICVE